MCWTVNLIPDIHFWLSKWDIVKLIFVYTIHFIRFCPKTRTGPSIEHLQPGPLRGGVSRGNTLWTMSSGGPNKQVESCFLNHNSSIHFCCTDSLLMSHMTHHGGLSLNIIIWRRGQVSFCPEAQKFSCQPCWLQHHNQICPVISK